ncbi:EB1 protein [Onchocerca flexuosa]|uniref:EB1 protein n=2 Tax=Onchocerca flexuosa TaxID=387005 RepID=A0A238BSS1_9BILA|nr:EB1 protein [Onchocerca flexuosa]
MVVNVYATSATIEQCSRNELLAFVNNFLRSNFTRIEELSSGAAYCQLTELLFPGKISLKKVKWNSRNEVDWIANWRILQTAWKDLGVKKPLPTSWAISSRSLASKPPVITRNNPAITPARKDSCTTVRKIAAGKTSAPNNVALQRKYELMIQELKQDLIELTKQRNFYYDKLRKVEVLCQEADDSPTVSREEVLEILYETQEGFAIIDEEPDYEQGGKMDNKDSKKNIRDATHQFSPDTSETF